MCRATALTLFAFFLSACGTAKHAPDMPTSEDDARGNLYRAKCAACHRLRPPAERTRAEWEKAVNRYGPRAHVTPTESNEILLWLQGHAKDVVPGQIP
jgi:cytochrome c2